MNQLMGVQAAGKVRVAVIREEGSNGDREMAAAVWSGGMEPWDVTMSDLLNGRASLDSFQGLPYLSVPHLSVPKLSIPKLSVTHLSIPNLSVTHLSNPNLSVLPMSSVLSM